MVEHTSNYPRTRKSLYTINHDFFSSIDTEEKAYWLGFITADGNVFSGPENKNRVSVQLAAYDDVHLRKLCASLGSNRPVLYSKRSEASVVFNSLPMIEDLGRVGVGPQKSLTVKPWAGPGHLMRHYWRGMVDGDGTISPKKGSGKWSVGLYGNIYCVAEFASWGMKVSGSRSTPHRTTPSSPCWVWSVGGTWMPQRLVAELYDGAEFYLDRKMSLAQELMRTEFKNPPKR